MAFRVQRKSGGMNNVIDKYRSETGDEEKMASTHPGVANSRVGGFCSETVTIGCSSSALSCSALRPSKPITNRAEYANVSTEPPRIAAVTSELPVMLLWRCRGELSLCDESEQWRQARH